MAATNYTPIQLYYSTTASAVPLAANLAQGELAINIADGKLYYEDSAGVVQVIATKGAGTIGGSNTQIQYNNSGALAGSSAMTFNSGTNTVTLTTLNLTNALGATYGGTAQSSYTQGDILYSSATNTLSKLGIGTVNYILTSTGSVPQWVAPTSVTVQTANNLAGGAAGSVPYQSAPDTTTFLSIGAANRVMTSSGTAPQWVTALTGLTGVSSSSITNTSLTSGRLVYSTTGGAQTDSSSLTFNGTTLSAGGYSTTGLSTLVKTVTIGNSNFDGSAVFAAATPAKLYIGTGTVTDTTSAIGATNAVGAISSLAITPIAATNTSVTYTNAATLYIAGAPSAGTNVTLTNPYALYVAAGDAYFGGTVTAGTVNLTTLDLTNLEVTNIKAKDGTASITLADSTGVASFTANPVLSGGTANGVLYLNGSKSATSGSALTFNGTTFGINTTIGNSTSLSITGDYTSNNVATFIGVQRTGGAVAGAWSYSDLLGSIQFGTTTNHTLVFLQNNAEAMRLNNTGLAIGSTSSLYTSKLTVAYNPTTTNGPITVDNRTFGINRGGSQWLGGQYNTAGDYRPYSGIVGAKENSTDGNSLGFLSFYVNKNAADAVEVGRFASTGYLGIGTNNPQELLHLSDTTPVFRMQGGSRTFQQYVGGTSFLFRDVTAGVNRTEIDASGYFGINTGGSTLNQYLTIGGYGGTIAGTAAISFWDGNSGGSRRWTIANGASASGVSQIGALTFNSGTGSFTADPLTSGFEIMRLTGSPSLNVGQTVTTGTVGAGLTDATTTFSSLSYGMLGLTNKSSTANNFTWMTFNESNYNYVAAIGTQNIAHSAASGAVYGDLVFATKTNGVGGFPTEKVRILSTGAFLVNTTGVGNRSAKAVVNGDFSPGIVTSGSGGFNWQSTQESGSIANSATYDYSLLSNTGIITGFGSIQVSDSATGADDWAATFSIIARNGGTVTIISSGNVRGAGLSGITLSIVNLGAYSYLRVTNGSGVAVNTQVQLNIFTYGY